MGVKIVKRQILIILLLCVCSHPANAEESLNDKLLLKKWALSYCLTTFSHAKDLAPIAAEATEIYYNQCLSKHMKFNGPEFDILIKFRKIRNYYNKHVHDYAPCKSTINCSFMDCLNVAEGMDFMEYLNSL